MGQKNSKLEEKPCAIIAKALRIDPRISLKKCFENEIFSLVPFEIWNDIVWFADLQSISILSQTCLAFKSLFETIAENNINLAKRFRLQGSIAQGLRCLELCANNNTEAIFYLADAYFYGGWGLQVSTGGKKKSLELFKKGAELGSSSCMMRYAFCLKNGYEIAVDSDLSDSWAEKALKSNDNYAIGYCYIQGIGIIVDGEKAFKYFELSANEGNEFGQFWLAYCYLNGVGVQQNRENSFEWFMKSALQGNVNAQYNVGLHFYRVLGEREEAEKWFRKTDKQGRYSERSNWNY